MARSKTQFKSFSGLVDLLDSAEQRLRIPELISDNPMEIECPSCRRQYTGLHDHTNESSIASIPIEKYEGYRCVSDESSVWLSVGVLTQNFINKTKIKFRIVKIKSNFT